MENNIKGPLYFGAISEEYTNLKRAKAVMLPVPYEKTTTYKKGAAGGPRAIIEASKYMETFDDELNQETYKIGIHTMDELAAGDISSEEMTGCLKNAVRDLIKAGKFPVVLGGEHSISVGPVAAFRESYEDLSVLYLDAHYDLRDEFNGSRFNHACAARRISELAPVVEVGVRSLSREEKDFLSNMPPKTRVDVINVYDILNDALWNDKVGRLLSKNVYISIDLDVFDPAIMPAVGTPEPGGIGWYEFLELLYGVIMEKNIVGMDVVELCPIKDQPASDFFAAKLIYRLLGYIFSSKRLSQLKKEEKDDSNSKEKDTAPKENVLHKGGGNPQRGA
ncbi:MAG: agmatinase [Candidatus Omnitrophica bacterium]|nr:agmatinase [Candidatus Omnitrophota bacterium]